MCFKHGNNSLPLTKVVHPSNDVKVAMAFGEIRRRKVTYISPAALIRWLIYW